jgi:hypothetical protein
MSFDQSTITSISKDVERGALNIDWTTTSPRGTWFQVYVDGQLAARTRSTSVSIPKPTAGAQIAVGAVASGDSQVRFAGGGFGAGGFGANGFGFAFPGAPANRIKLTWIGGAFLDTLGTVGGFYVFDTLPATGFGEGGYGDGGVGFAGSPFDLDGSPLANIPAYTNGIATSGFGMGGFGAGGFGSASASYSWTSGPLAGGVWTFAVVAYDTAGNLGTPAFETTTILAPPAPPALFDDGRRLHAVVTGGAIVLTWNPSPS